MKNIYDFLGNPNCMMDVHYCNRRAHISQPFTL